MGINKRFLYVSRDTMDRVDFFREEIGSVWNESENSITFGAKVPEKSFRLEFGPVTVTEGALTPYVAKHQLVKLTADTKKFGVYPQCLQCGWDEYVDQIFARTSWARGKDPQSALILLLASRKPDHVDEKYFVFNDCVFSIEAPLTKIESDLIGATSKLVHGNVDFDYDYYLEDYEKAVEDLGLSEIELPNLYLKLGKEQQSSIFAKLRDNGRCRAKEYIALIGEKYHTLLIPNDIAKGLDTVNTFKEFIPFQAEVSFSTDRLTSAADALSESAMDCSLMRRLSEHEKNFDKIFSLSRDLFIAKKGKTHRITEISKPRVKTYNFFTWLGSQLEGLDASGNLLTEELPKGHIFVGPDNDSTMMALSGQKSGLKKMMSYLLLSGRVKDILAGNTRTFQEICLGAESHSETLIYKIEKHNTLMYDLYEKSLIEDDLEPEPISKSEFIAAGRGPMGPILDALAEPVPEVDGNTPVPIQTIWVANSGDIDVFEYIDTQVKYGEDYTYIVSAYQLVVGTEYFYSTTANKCDSWTVGLSLNSREQYSVINEHIETSETMEMAYDSIITYLHAIGYDVGGIPAYNGGELILTQNPDGTAILTSGCGDADSETNRKRCIEDMCEKFNNLRNMISEEDLASGRLEAEVSKRLRKLTGNDPYRTYSNMLQIGQTISEALEKMRLILLNLLMYSFKHKYTGLNISTEDRNGNLVYTVTRDWQFSNTQDPLENYASYNQSGNEISGQGKHPGINKPKKANQFRQTLDFPFSINKVCPTSLDPCETLFAVTTMPRAMIYEIPYFAYNGTMIDTPPVPPGVDIIPYRGINNQLLFNFNTGIGDYYDIPKPIFPQDIDRFKKVLNAQAPGRRKTIRFKSDDPAYAFQIFRSEEEPRKYTDFANNLIKTVRTDVDPNTIQKADAASYVDNLMPNKKYYYVFRTVDIHGHVSNPSSIFEVELVDDDGAVYPVVRSREIEEYTPDRGTLSKSMMKLMHIVPRITQGIVNEERSNLGSADSALKSGSDIILGVQEESIWGKRFKVRLSSIKTGKKIDLNINFKTKHIENPDKDCKLDVVASTRRTTR